MHEIRDAEDRRGPRRLLLDLEQTIALLTGGHAFAEERELDLVAAANVGGDRAADAEDLVIRMR